jgi:hypothetical protein
LASALGAVPLKQLLRDDGWLIDVWAAMAVVLLPAMLLRRQREAQPWHVWPGLVLLVPWLTAWFVPHHALFGFIPTGGTWTDVGHLLSDLHDTTSHEVAPIDSTHAVRLVLCAMLGLLAALVDLIAVVGRRGALAGVPLLIVFTVSGAVPRHSVAWPWFVIGAVGFLVLLSLDAEDDLRAWGRRIPRPGHAAGGVSPRIGISAQRIGLLALAAAVALPLLVPTHKGNLLSDLFRNGHSTSGGFGRGGGGSSISPFVTLKGDLSRPKAQDLFTVRLSDGSRSPFYARVNVLSRYTGDGWSRGPAGTADDVQDDLVANNFPVDPDVANDISGAEFSATITISGLRGNAPVFTRPIDLSGVGSKTQWNRGDQLLTGDTVAKNDSITEAWVQPTPTVAELQAATGPVPSSLSPELALPAELPAYVKDLVATLTRTKTTPYAKARAVFDYFTDQANGFVYSLHTKTGDSGSDLVDFLTGREGFCQQYAAAMAVMLRQAAIPARVVLGYTHAAPDKQHQFTVTTDDAHSWVEAYFSGIGWIPFDPTPVNGIHGGANADPGWAPHPKASSASVNPSTSAPSTSAPTSTGPTTSASSSAPAAASASSSTSLGPLIGVLVGIVAVAVIVLIPAGVRAGRRRRRLAGAVHSGRPDPLWAELADSAVDLGYPWSPARSPRQVAQWLRRDAAGAAPALDALATAVEASRYGPASGGADMRALGDGLGGVVRALRAQRSGRIRFWSRIWPASLGLGSRFARRR